MFSNRLTILSIPNAQRPHRLLINLNSQPRPGRHRDKTIDLIEGFGAQAFPDGAGGSIKFQ